MAICTVAATGYLHVVHLNILYHLQIFFESKVWLSWKELVTLLMCNMIPCMQIWTQIYGGMGRGIHSQGNHRNFDYWLFLCVFSMLNVIFSLGEKLCMEKETRVVISGASQANKSTFQRNTHIIK